MEKKLMTKKEEIKQMIERLIEEMQEEDIGISLFTTHYQDHGELNFFTAPDRERVGAILKKLSEDSKRHKKILEKIINHLERKCHAA